MQIYEELVARGLIAQVTNEEEIKKLVNEANRSELSVSKYCLARSATMKFAL